MESIVRQLLFCVFCVIANSIASTSGSSLPGSCIAAGYTTCCVGTDCLGEPPTCLCDQSCREHHDCCADVDEICAPKMIILSEVLSSVKPVFLFATYTTFHSASLQWATSSPNHTLLDVNVTYVVKYHIVSDPEDMDTFNASNEILIFTMKNKTQYYIGDGLYRVMLTQLSPNTTYSCKVEVQIAGLSTSSGTNTVSFTTLAHTSVQKLRITLHNSTSIKLSWDPVELPSGVHLLHYTLYYSFGELEMSRQFGLHDTCGIIGGLRVHKKYRFSISATVIDVDGSVSESLRSSFIPIFVPDVVLFQLTGWWPHPCSEWNVDTEQHLLTAFQTSSVQMIHTQCNCLYPDTYIKDTVLLCQNGNTDDSDHTQHLSFATFRATALSTENVMTETILTYLEEWVSSEPVIHSGPDNEVVTLQSNCSTSLRLRSDPMCTQIECDLEENGVTQNLMSNSTSVGKSCISLPIFTAALVAELLFLLAVMLVGVIIAVVKLSRRKTAIEGQAEVSTTQRPTVQNLYEVRPTNSAENTPSAVGMVAPTESDNNQRPD